MAHIFTARFLKDIAYTEEQFSESMYNMLLRRPNITIVDNVVTVGNFGANAGGYSIQAIGTQDFTITESGFIYIEFTRDSGANTSSFSLVFDTSIPADTVNTKYGFVMEMTYLDDANVFDTWTGETKSTEILGTDTWFVDNAPKEMLSETGFFDLEIVETEYILTKSSHSNLSQSPDYFPYQVQGRVVNDVIRWNMQDTTVDLSEISAQEGVSFLIYGAGNGHTRVNDFSNIFLDIPKSLLLQFELLIERNEDIDSCLCDRHIRNTLSTTIEFNNDKQTGKGMGGLPTPRLEGYFQTSGADKDHSYTTIINMFVGSTNYDCGMKINRIVVGGVSYVV